MKTYATTRKLPTAADANRLGYVFARLRTHTPYEGVKWNRVNRKDYDRWFPAKPPTAQRQS